MAEVAPRSASGQASVELAAMLPALLLAALLLFQVGAVGYSMTLVDGAAEAGAIALVSGQPAKPAVRSALPGWARDRVAVSVVGGRVDVSVRPPSPIGALADRLRVKSTAAVAMGE